VGRVALRRSAVGLSLAAVATLAGCASEPRWRATRNPDAIDAAAALASDVGSLRRELRADEVPVIPVRERLRPCCAFGSRLRVRVGALKIPGYNIANIRGPREIGHHNYDAGKRGNEVAEGEEKNGLVYTCRGGFVDTAHIRDYADWTLFLASEIGRNLETGAVIDLPDEEGGHRRFVLKLIDPELLHAVGRRAIAMPLAVWAGFQMSVWHEIATWYGWSAIGAFPEKASAFSPEDLYSNLLGAKLLVPIVGGGAHMSEDLFDRAVDAWLAQALAFLGAVDAELGDEVMGAVDQLWWDSTAHLPDEDLVLRRNLQLGNAIEPWLIPEIGANRAIANELRAQCANDLQPHVLRNPSRIPGLAFEDQLTLEIELSKDLARQPAFSEFGATVTQRDFPALAEGIRKEVIQQYGPLGDTPDPAPGP